MSEKPRLEKHELREILEFEPPKPRDGDYVTVHKERVILIPVVEPDGDDAA